MSIPHNILRVVANANDTFEDRRWETMNPTFSQIAITDSDCKYIIQTHFSKYMDLFHRIKTGAGRSDICRIVAVWKYGGFYADTDTSLRGPLTMLLKYFKHSSLITSSRYSFEFFGASPQNNILLHVLDAQMSNINRIVNGSATCIGPQQCVVRTTGPYVFKMQLSKFALSLCQVHERWDCNLVRHWACATTIQKNHKRPCSKRHYSRLHDASSFYEMFKF